MKQDATLEYIRKHYLGENPKINPFKEESIYNSLPGASEFSVASIFDDKVYRKEIKQKRKIILESLPKNVNPILACKIIAHDVEQIHPNMVSVFDTQHVVHKHRFMGSKAT